MTVVIHQHSADFDHFFQQEVDGQQRKEIKYIFEIADAVLALSDTWADFFRTLVSAPEKVLVLPNAVACPVENKSDYSDHRILFLGRLGERKGTFDLLQAAPALQQFVEHLQMGRLAAGEAVLVFLLAEFESAAVFFRGVNGTHKNPSNRDTYRLNIGR